MPEELLKEIRDLLIEIRDILTAKGLSDTTAETVIIQASNKNKSWKDYLEEKQTKNDYEIIALVVERLASNGKESVAKEEIMEFVRRNPHLIKNTGKVADSIKTTKDNKAYRYIEFVDKKTDKTYRLSIKGKQLVDSLPTTYSDK